MKDDVICVARYRKVGHGTIGLRENSSFARFASRRTSNSDMAEESHAYRFCSLSELSMISKCLSKK